MFVIIYIIPSSSSTAPIFCYLETLSAVFSPRKIVMDMHMKIRILISLFVFTFLQQIALADTATVKKIGVVLPLSGPMSIVGTAIRDGMELSHNAGDGLELIFEDDQYMPRNSVLAVQRLIDGIGVDGLVVFGSGPSIAVSEIAEQRKVPLISFAMNDNVGVGKHYVFRLFMTGETQNKALSDAAGL